METVTITARDLKTMMDDIKSIKVEMKARINPFTRWIDEETAMAITGLSKSSLQKKRREGLFNYTSPSGKKIKYFRKDIEDYLENNSSLKISQKKTA